MLLSAFRGEEAGKMVIKRFHWKVKCYAIFKSIVSNMIGTAIFKYPNQVYELFPVADDLKIANKIQSTRSQYLI